MFVIDRVKFSSLDQAKQMWKLKGHHSTRLEQFSNACNEVIDIRHVGKHVVGHDEVGALACSDKLERRFPSEEFRERWHARRVCDVRHVARRLDAQHRHRNVLEVLEQRTIVARNLHHQTLRPKFETATCHVRKRAYMLEPRR